MNEYLNKALGYHVNRPQSAFTEVEISESLSGEERRERFLNYVQNILKGGKINDMRFVQRLDLIPESTPGNADHGVSHVAVQCRVHYHGKERKSTEFMCKETKFQVQLGSATLNVAYEHPQPEFKLTSVKVAIIKIRVIFELEHWVVDFLAYSVIKNTKLEEIAAKRINYFKNPILTINDYLKFIGDRRNFFSGFRIEFELKKPEDIAKNLPAIIQEYMDYTNVVYGVEVLAVQYQNLLSRVVAQYAPHWAGGAQSLKKVTVNVKTLDNSLFERYFPFENWYVAEKTDGVHALLYIDAYGNIYLFERVLHCLFETPSLELAPNLIMGSDEGLITILDGEVITVTVDGVKTKYFVVFDVIMHNSIRYFARPFSERVAIIDEAAEAVRDVFGLRKIDIVIHAKKFKQLPPKDNSIKYEETLRSVMKSDIFPTDGIIYVEPGTPYLATTILKWKRGEENTVDFLAKTPHQADQLKQFQQPGKQLYLLFCTVSQSDYLRSPPSPLVRSLFEDQVYRQNSCPALFKTSLAPNMFFINVDEGTELDGKILEVSPRWVDAAGTASTSHTEGATLTWKYNRIREDRALDQMSGTYYGNYFNHAEQNLLLFVYPITFKMLLDGPANSDRYFKTVKGAMYKSATKFNLEIKKALFQKYTLNTDHLLDLAAGRGSDIWSYYECIKQRVFVIEPDQEAIKEMVRRKHSILSSESKSRLKYMPHIYIIEHNLLATSAHTIAKLQTFGAPQNEKREMIFDTVTCHFALHYFARNESEIEQLFKVIRAALRPGGRFIFTIMNPERVKALLSVQPKNEWIFTSQETVKYHLRYKEGSYNNDIEILLPFTNGELIEESLVNVEQLLTKFTNNGFRLVERFDFSEMYTADYAQIIRDMDNGDKAFCGLYCAIILEKK